MRLKRIFKQPDNSHAKGFTLIELIVTVGILSVLAGAALPMLQTSVKRQKESRLRDNLREIRLAIDAYKTAYDKGHIEKKLDASGYPPDLNILVEGVQDLKDPNKKKLKFLRRIPDDPFYTPEYLDDSKWGLRSYESSPDDPREGEDVYDVYSMSPLTGTNRIPYAQW